MGILLKISGKQKDEILSFLEIAADMIIEGKIIAFPTNSVYGLGGDPLNLKVVRRICQLKFREKEKGFLLLVTDLEEAKKIAEFNEIGTILAQKFWPGQLTLILKRKENSIISPEVTGSEYTIGLRVPENQVILEILKILKAKGHFGGIIGTSANYSGEEPSTSGEQVARTFLGPIDIIIDDGKTVSSIETTILDCTEEHLKFLRIGKVTEDEILKSIEKKDFGVDEQ